MLKADRSPEKLAIMQIYYPNSIMCLLKRSCFHPRIPEGYQKGRGARKRACAGAGLAIHASGQQLILLSLTVKAQRL